MAYSFTELKIKHLQTFSLKRVKESDKFRKRIRTLVCNFMTLDSPKINGFHITLGFDSHSDKW